jgi:XRE family transcriptional regulator, regulator of sulfur utilization
MRDVRKTYKKSGLAAVPVLQGLNLEVEEGRRQALGMSLEDLARKSGVSKSMLSQIERNQANPTVALVWRLANALGVSIADLLEMAQESPPALQVLAAHATPALKSPDGKCELRILGPLETAGQFEWYELNVQPGGVLESQPHEPGSREHLTVLTGTLEVQAGAESTRLKLGETARYAVDIAHAIRNPAKSAASAVLVVMHSARVNG